MNREQLEEMRKRADWFKANTPGAGEGPVNTYGWAAAAIKSAQDVPALLDEIDRVAADMKIMVDGWLALTRLNDHAEMAVGMVSLRSDSAASWCEPCSKFASALMRGAKPVDVLDLRCAAAQEWHRQVDAATALTTAEGSAEGGTSKGSEVTP